MSRYTPGPWEIEPERFVGHIYHEPRVVADEKTIAVVRVGLDGTDANARLIAAAPDLLTACQVIGSRYHGSRQHHGPFEVCTNSWCKVALDSIAKATQPAVESSRGATKEEE